MNRLGLLLAMHLLASSLLAQNVILRTVTDPEASGMLGERVILKVDVLGKDAWAKLPKVPTVQIPGAIVFVPPSQSTRLSESIEGDSYTGQQYEWWIYPQRAGELLIPPLSLTIENRKFGSKDEPDPVDKVTDGQKLSIRKPEGVVANDGLVATSSLKITQAWSDKPESVSVGDGITRTIVRVIKDAPSLVLPPIDFGSLKGVRSYSKEGRTENLVDRGELTGNRTDTVTYIFEDAGQIDLPSISATWFDTQSKSLRTETLDGLTVRVNLPESQSNEQPDAPGSDSGVSSTLNSKVLFTVLGFIVLLAVFVFRYRLADKWRRRVESRSLSEPAFYSRFEASAKSQDPSATLRDLTHWSDSVQSEQLAPRLDQLFASYGDAMAQQHLANLQSAITRQQPTFDTTDLRTSVKLIRRKVNGSKRRSVSTERSTLPPMRRAS